MCVLPESESNGRAGQGLLRMQELPKSPEGIYAMHSGREQAGAARATPIGEIGSFQMSTSTPDKLSNAQSYDPTRDLVELPVAGYVRRTIAFLLDQIFGFLLVLMAVLGLVTNGMYAIVAALLIRDNEICRSRQ